MAQLDGKWLKAKDINLVRIEVDCPEQYEAYTPDGGRVGYIRIRWGYCIAWCPDAGGKDEVYAAELKCGWWNFGSNKERRKHLRRAKDAIAAWCNEHPGVYGELI